ncbi:hypothetical protein C0Q70_04249 [Pomacea canaliculata]|uniref:Reverse transcriptase domain-containing protein n=1 Tax=Pomacea canaliculata TaxID=400727 RepID=A0A2T7PV06_POMCA|nr:hypothetical protein C0Q70_04249 [Pomacea canaliculata]
MKSCKAPGADGITAEMLKADVNVTAPMLAEIFRQIWESGQLPVACKIGLIVKLPKKGDLGDCNNWRGITLLSLTSKVSSKIVLSRLTVLARGARGVELAFDRDGSPLDSIDYDELKKEIREECGAGEQQG